MAKCSSQQMLENVYKTVFMAFENVRSHLLNIDFYFMNYARFI